MAKRQRKLLRKNLKMSKPFLLTPNLYNKLTGRHLKLICSSPHCLHSTGSSDIEWDRKIEPLGYGKCPRCKSKTDIKFFEYDESKALEMAHDTKVFFRAKAKLILPKCENCGCIMKRVNIHYIQWVVSKHRKSHHYYFHKECFDSMFLAESGEELFKKMKYKMNYAGSSGHGCIIYLPFDPRKGICEGCGKSKHVLDASGNPQIKMTSLHHWVYAYKPETVKKNPILVLDNTSELCFACHQIADGLRAITKLSPARVVSIASLMSKDLKVKFDVICKMWMAENK